MPDRLVFRVRSLGLTIGYTIECEQLSISPQPDHPIARFFQAIVECVRRSAGRDGDIEIFNSAGELIEQLTIEDAFRATT